MPLDTQGNRAPLLDAELQATRISSHLTTERTREEIIEANEEREPSLRPSRPQQRAIRKTLAILIGAIPVYFLALEMTAEHCHFCQTKSVAYYVVTAAVCGGTGATLYGYSRRYWYARCIAGVVAALGSLFVMRMILKSISSNAVVFFFAMVVGIFGAMPGFLTYFLLTTVLQECRCSCIATNTHDGEEEIVPLVKVTLHNVISTNTVGLEEEEMEEEPDEADAAR